MIDTLVPQAERIAALLTARKQTIAVAESSSGGLIAAALLAVPGASAYFAGGAVVYTRDARRLLTGITNEQMRTTRSSSEPYAQMLAADTRARFATHWRWLKPARPGRPATAMATPPAIAASPLRDRFRRR